MNRQAYDAVQKQVLSYFGRTEAPYFVLARLLDPAPSGEPHEVGRPPPCPNGHGSDSVSFEGDAEPLEVRKVLRPLVGHSRWDALSESERRSEVDRLIEQWRVIEPAESKRLDALAARSKELRLRRQADADARTSGSTAVPETWRDPRLARRFILVALGFGVPFSLLWSLVMSLIGFPVPTELSLALSLLAGLAFAAVMTGLMRHPRVLLGEARLQLEGTEVLLRDGPANHRSGREMVGGWLWLTDRRLVFRSHGLNLRREELDVPLAEIAESKAQALFGFIPTGIRLQGRGRADDVFAVTDRGAWIEAIERAVSTQRSLERP